MEMSSANGFDAGLVAGELLRVARELTAADEAKYDVYGKRDGKMGKWNKKPMTMSEAQGLMKEIEKARIPSVDVRSLETRLVKGAVARELAAMDKAEAVEVLRKFAARNGRRWKSALREAWETGSYRSLDLKGVDSSDLQRIRNQFGPSWLHSLRLKKAASGVTTEVFYRDDFKSARMWYGLLDDLGVPYGEMAAEDPEGVEVRVQLRKVVG